MTTDIERRMVEFLSSRVPGALALTGPWGAGKTFLWQQRVLPALIKKPWKKKYSYVSLFGINSLPELKIALAVATEQFDYDALRQKRLLASPIRLFWRLWKWLSDLLSILPKSGTGFSKLFDRIGFYLVRDRIICFDDIERRGSGLHLRDVLGLVSYLSEQRSCKIVVIMNEGQLNSSDQEVWSDFREKVFLGELKFDPTPQQTVDLGLQNNKEERWHQPLCQALKELKISNIRLIRRSASFMELAEQSIEGCALPPEMIEHMVRSVAILVWSIHGRGAGGPPLERVRRGGQLNLGIYSGNNPDSRTSQEKAWDLQIRDYGSHMHMKIDEALISMIENGFPDSNAMRTAVDADNANIDRNARSEDWHNAWKLYHGTISENGAEIVAAFENSWPYVSEHEHVGNLQSAANLLRLLGRPDLASNFIRLWVGQRSGTRIRELESRALNLTQRVDDNEIIELVDATIRNSKQNIPTEDAIRIISDGHGDTENAIDSLANCSVDEMISLVDGMRSDDIFSSILDVLKLRSHESNPRYLLASETMRQACARIASRSPLAADRVRNRLSIDPYIDTTSPSDQ